MTTYTVTVQRTETIAFSVEADNAAEAEEKFLSEGDETASRTSAMEIVSIEKEQ